MATHNFDLPSHHPTSTITDSGLDDVLIGAGVPWSAVENYTNYLVRDTYKDLFYVPLITLSMLFTISLE